MNAKDLVKIFASGYKARFSKEYPVAWTKHPAMMKRLLGFYDAGTIMGMITLYFERNDSFTQQAGHSLEVFVSQVPKLIAAIDRIKAGKPSTSPDYERLENARKASSSNEGFE